MRTRLNRPALIAFLCTVAVLLGGSIVSPRMLSFNYIIQQLYIASFLGILAGGATLVILLGHIDLSLPWALTTAAIISTALIEKGTVVAILAGLGVGLAVGLLNSVGVIVLRVPSMIWTLGINYVFLGISVYLTGGFAPKGNPIDVMRLLGVGRSILGIPNAIFVWAVISLVLSLLLRFSRSGRYIYAVGNSEKVAYLSGIRTPRVTILVFCIAGLCNAFAGMMLSGYANQAYQAMGDPYQLQTIAAVVVGGTSILGGRGTYLGTIAGVILITFISSFLSILQIPEGGRMIIFGAVIIFMLLIYGREQNVR
jgi:ribose transport system permease protein